MYTVPAAPPPVRPAVRPADEESCVRLAASPETGPEVLRVLARDGRVTVRGAVALNLSTPDGVDAALADDSDQRVRQLLGHKLALLVPGLSSRGQQTLRQQAMTTLRRLVDDEAERVRKAIADILKDMPHAPRELILQLARDAAVPVSEPVLRLSPVLTTSDLLSLLTDPPAPAAARAIAARAELPAEVADAIAEMADPEAIRVLLENRSANIQEAALDALAVRAGAHEAWHEPMVRRPKLSGRAATALSEVVTTHLLQVLAHRPDLPADIAGTLKRQLAARAAAELSPRRAATGTEAVAQARALRAAGKLDEAAIRAAAATGDAGLCAAMLAVAADLPIGVVERAATLRSAKGIASLVWLARFSMELAVILQLLVGKVAPNAVLQSLDGTDFPLTEDEMRWQIDLLRQMGR